MKEFRFTFYCRNLAVGTTKDGLSTYLRKRGLDIGPECISVHLRKGELYPLPNVGAAVHVPREKAATVLQWLLDNCMDEGKLPSVFELDAYLEANPYVERINSESARMNGTEPEPANVTAIAD